MIRILQGDCLETLKSLPDNSVHCCVTSPPYFGLRDYGVEGQIGLEPTPEQFVETMVAVFREVRRVLRDDGVLWLNLGDSYNAAGRKGHGTRIGYKQQTNRASAEGADHVRASSPAMKQKDLMLIPTTVAAALRDDGWYLRDAAIWHKPNPMPTSQQDRCTFAYEYMFQLTKSKRYYFDMERVREEATYAGNKRGSRKDSRRDEPHVAVNSMNSDTGSHRIPRNVWTISTQGFKEAHFATYPEKLIELPIKASTGEQGCCGCCGTPFKRIVEKVRRPTRPGEKTKTKMPDGWDTGEGGHGSFHREGREKGKTYDTAITGNRDPQRHVTETVTTGWEPGCECGEIFGSVPCTVLDPFCGSGTSGVVAERFGCDFIGCELNPEYIEIAKRRILGVHPDVEIFVESLQSA